MDDSSRPARAGRLNTIQSALAGQRLDALVVSSPINITYLTGFTGTAGLLYLTPSRQTLIVDGRYDFAARTALRDAGLDDVGITRVEKRYDLTLAEAIATSGEVRVGFEAAAVTVATLGSWQRAAPAVTFVATERVVERSRVIKDAGEIASLRRGGALIARVARDLQHLVVRGKSERDIADAIDRAMREAGFERPAFPTIVASGPHSALPHARPGSRQIAQGDLVVLDFGGVLDGYCVDLTRMAAAGRISPAAQALYDGVRAANAAATAAVRPGVETSAIDEAARNVLDAAGFGDAFLHGTGHGLGLEVHEAPRIARQDPETTEIIERGMVFTIEPGAYVEGVGGVRLEDDVLVTAEGVEVLTETPRDLILV